jgi:hypothetical protein
VANRLTAGSPSTIPPSVVKVAKRPVMPRLAGNSSGRNKYRAPRQRTRFFWCDLANTSDIELALLETPRRLAAFQARELRLATRGLLNNRGGPAISLIDFYGTMDKTPTPQVCQICAIDFMDRCQMVMRDKVTVNVVSLRGENEEHSLPTSRKACAVCELAILAVAHPRGLRAASSGSKWLCFACRGMTTDNGRCQT